MTSTLMRFAASRSLLLLGMLTFSPLVSPCAPEVEHKPITVERDGLEVQVGSPVGLSIALDGVPFSSSSTFYAVHPGWTGRYYGYEDDPGRVGRASVTEPGKGITRIDIPMAGRSGDFQATQTIEVGPGRILRLSVDAQLTSGTGALENMVGGILSGWISGRNYQVVSPDGRTQAGVLPGYARFPGIAESTVAKGFQSLRIEGRTGPIDILTSGAAPVSLVDYRANRYADNRPIYWFGVLETPFGESRRMDYTIVMKFPPAVRASVDRPVRLTQRPVSDTDVIARDIAVDRIIPTPKKVQWGRGNFNVSEETRIAAFGASAQDSALVDEQVAELQAYMAREFGVKVPRIPQAAAEKAFSARKSALSAYNYDPSLTTIGGAIVVNIHKPAPGTAPWRSEEYRIRVAGGAVIDAQSTEGLANGMKTLRQLFRQRSGRVYLRECDVADWPSLSLRAIHFFSGKDARDLQVRMVRDVLGALKLNHIVYQCEYIKWQRAPEIHSSKFGMEKADAEAVLAEARRQHIEVTPLINTFGHMEWFFANGANLSMADNPAEPYAYDPQNPDVYRLTGQIYEEAIEMFRPRWFHIGHDEVTMMGFPVKEENVRAGVAELVQRDIRHYHDFLGSRGIRTMIWGDMFLGPHEAPDACNAPTVAEAQRRRAALPKDIIIADWHYAAEPAARFTSLKTWMDEGFDTIACPWYNPRNVVELARAAAAQRDTTTTIAVATAQPDGATTIAVATGQPGSHTTIAVAAAQPESATTIPVAAAQPESATTDSIAVAQPDSISTKPVAVAQANSASTKSVTVAQANSSDTMTAAKAVASPNIAKRGQMLGLMQTTWAGYSFGIDSFEENSEQYAAYVLAAEAAWTGGASAAEEMPYDYRAEFDRIWLRDCLPKGTAGGWCVDLSRAANLRLSRDKDKPWLGYMTGADMSGVPKGRNRLGRYTFLLPSLGREPAAVLLSGRWHAQGNLPSRLVVPVDATASAVAFATAATLGSAAGSVVAETTVAYDDGTTLSLPWKMGRNVFAIDDVRTSVGCPVVWEKTADGEMPRAIHAHLWLNPHPDKRIRSLQFDSGNSGCALMLFGITGIQKSTTE
jgi:hypothetical protein